MENKKFSPPYLGSAYYPEDWDEAQQDYDIEMMKKAGMNCARIAEFDWYGMEPSDGVFTFEKLHRVVDKLGQNGIAVILGTPTATPPVWFFKAYPEACRETVNGRKAVHGGRRHYCSNNPDYIRCSLRIAEKMAIEFKDDPSVIGWQIDNEIYTHDEGCFCEHCVKEFHAYLKEQYGTIEELNERWNLHVFSQAYESFDDIPAPRDAWHNPHLKQAWKIFQGISHVKFVHAQADILHKYVKVPVGTDTMPVYGIDYRKLNEKLDIVQFNHYNTKENHYRCFLWMDYLRTLLPHPFWNTETEASWNGSAEIGMSLPEEGFIRLNSVLPVALGGEANLYWLWRTHWAGHELMHGAVLDTSGRPSHTFGEIKNTAEIFEKARDFLNGTKIETKVALHHFSVNWIMLQCQGLAAGNSNERIFDFYNPLLDCGLRPDVTDACQPLEKYDLIFSPLTLTMEENGLPGQMRKWVEDGGVWVAGPFTDIRNTDGAKYKDRHFGFLEELTGAKWLYGIPDHSDRVKTEWVSGEKAGQTLAADTWYDVFEENCGTPLVKITEGHSAICGKPCVLHCKVGKGHVILLGTFPAREEMGEIVKYAASLAGIPCGNAEGKVIAAPRKGEAGEGLTLLEYGGENACYTFEGKMTDILTGKVYENRAELSPYDILILKKEN